MHPSKLIQQIQELRISNKLSQQELATLAQVPFATINRLENGKANPTLETLSKILAVFGYELTIQRETQAKEDRSNE
jgi:transcriptional regulator with XRE-family HTH domain